MKINFKLLLTIVCLISLSGCSEQTSLTTISDTDLERGFVTPPDSIQTSVYWYWISGNISKEGVQKDLESMKEVGINRAFIGNIGLDSSKVKLFSDEWWEITHAALKRAGELGIDIGLFNCPGWSQAGGPWIQPSQSMRYLASVKTKINGGKKVSVKLPKPDVNFQDVKVVAYPYYKENDLNLSNANASVSSEQLSVEASKLMDDDMSTEVLFKTGRAECYIEAHDSFSVRSLTIYTAHCGTRMQGELLVKEGMNYRSLAQFDIDRTNAMVEVGFDAYAPVTITVPKIVAKEFYLKFSDIMPGSGLKEIQLSAMPKVERYSEKTLAKMYQTPLPYWNEYQWRQQADSKTSELSVDPESILDITDCFSNDILSWDAPEGDWQIVRYGMLPTLMENGPAADEGRGLEVDKMTSTYLSHHFDSFLGRIMARIPFEDRTSLKVCVADSYEKGGQNFTDTFLEDFKNRYGYDAFPFLPVFNGVVVKNRDVSDRFLWDVRRMVADKLAYEHIGAMRELVHKYGLTMWLENYGHWGFPGEFLQYGGQSDEVAGEFWSEGDLGNIENRAASSCAHIYGKTKVSSESFTCGGEPFSRYPAIMKQRGDLFFSEGINNTLLHLYISQPQDSMAPGMNAPFGNEFNRLNTWFPHMDLFVRYLKRTNFMLQQGRNVADIAYFIGEDTPKMTGITDPPLPKGYQFDYINSEVILNGLTVKDGLLTLPHGTQYKVLVLPRLETMRPELLAKIKKLVENGALVLGPKPLRSPSYENYPSADVEVKKLADDLWGEVDGVKVKHAFYGKGMIMSGMSLEEVFDLIHYIPDFETTAEAPVLYNHRDLGKTQIYFVTNQSDSTVSITPKFRVSNKMPELWEATSGNIRILPSYVSEGESTTVPLKLEAYESIFVVFRSAQQKMTDQPDINLNYPAPSKICEVDTPWVLSFDSTKTGPKEPVIMDVLSDLSTSKDERIKYYSGTIHYSTTVQLPEKITEGEWFLKLTDVAVMAKVKINGKYIGGLWTAPYKLKITERVLQPGNNALDIEVVNTWVNRLIGDSALPEEKRSTYIPYNTWTPRSELQKSGLIGEVKLECVMFNK